MIKKILDCSSTINTKLSITNIFNTTEVKLNYFLESLSPTLTIHQANYLYNCACEKFGVPTLKIEAIWFHGSRVKNPEIFMKNGIIPKNKIKEEIMHMLSSLAEDLESKGDNRFSMSWMSKQGKNDEGPFAVLFKDVLKNPRGTSGDFLATPELVEDIAGILLGQNYKELVNLYQEITYPCIISFKEQADEYELSKALMYLYLIVNGNDSIEAANDANTCFDAEGNIIAPEKIIKVDTYPKSNREAQARAD